MNGSKSYSNGKCKGKQMVKDRTLKFKTYDIKHGKEISHGAYFCLHVRFKGITLADFTSSSVISKFE